MNPYNASEAVEKIDDFIGRDKEKKRINEFLQASANPNTSQHFAFIGDPTLGKTSYLNLVADYIKNDYSENLFYVKCDLTSKEGNKIEFVLLKILKELINSLVDTDPEDNIIKEAKNFFDASGLTGIMPPNYNISDHPFYTPLIFNQINDSSSDKYPSLVDKIKEAFYQDLKLLVQTAHRLKTRKVVFLIDNIQTLKGEEGIWGEDKNADFFMDVTKMIVNNMRDKVLFVITTYPIFLKEAHEFSRFFPPNRQIEVRSDFTVDEIEKFILKPLPIIVSERWALVYNAKNDALDKLKNWIRETVSGAYEIKRILELLYDNFGEEGIVNFDNNEAILRVFEGIKEGQSGDDYQRYIKKIEKYSLPYKIALLALLTYDNQKAKNLKHCYVFDLVYSLDSPISEDNEKSIISIVSLFNQSKDFLIKEGLFIHNKSNDTIEWNDDIFSKRYLRYYLKMEKEFKGLQFIQKKQGKSFLKGVVANIWELNILLSYKNNKKYEKRIKDTFSDFNNESNQNSFFSSNSDQSIIIQNCIINKVIQDLSISRMDLDIVSEETMPSHSNLEFKMIFYTLSMDSETSLCAFSGTSDAIKRINLANKILLKLDMELIVIEELSRLKLNYNETFDIVKRVGITGYEGDADVQFISRLDLFNYLMYFGQEEIKSALYIAETRLELYKKNTPIDFKDEFISNEINNCLFLQCLEQDKLLSEKYEIIKKYDYFEEKRKENGLFDYNCFIAESLLYNYPIEIDKPIANFSVYAISILILDDNKLKCIVLTPDSEEDINNNNSSAFYLLSLYSLAKFRKDIDAIAEIYKRLTLLFEFNESDENPDPQDEWIPVSGETFSKLYKYFEDINFCEV